MLDCGDCKKCEVEPKPKVTLEGVGGTLWFSVTRRCNFNCTYCFQGSHAWTWQEKKGLLKFMPNEVIEKSIEFAKVWGKNAETKSGDSPDLAICWYGGEPLLRKSTIQKWTPRLLKDLSEDGRKVRVSITTNGSLMEEDMMKFMKEHSVGMLFSLDGPPWVHNKTRVFAGGKPSWESIPIDKILKWRPSVEIAWQLSPDNVPEPSDLDWMMDKGFFNVNFNINWLSEWTLEKQSKLRDFMYHAMRLAIESKRGGKPFNSNWYGRIEKLIRGGGKREAKPCGTGPGMISVTPEGDLYPSQEMGFMVHEPDRAPGTAEFYRLGNVYNTPVWEPQDKLERIFALKNDDMIPPLGRDCVSCPIRTISFGGCHCRYVGQDGEDPSNRYDVMPGWCQSQIAAASGGLLAFAREGWIERKVQTSSDKVGTFDSSTVAKRPLSIVDLDKKLDLVLDKLEEK